jgi:hypothetical protein
MEGCEVGFAAIARQAHLQAGVGGVMIDLTSLRGIERNDNPTCGKTVLACG